MNEFFNTDQDTDQEELDEKANAEQEAQYRADVTAELFEGKAPVEETAATKTKDSDDTDDIDDTDESDKQDSSTDDSESIKTDEADSKVPDELAKISKSLNMLTANVNGFEDRLKQAERRIGGLNNKLHEAKQVPKTDQSSPTDAQIESAAKSDEGWEDLQKNFPDWAKAFENRIAQAREDLVSKEDLESLRSELSQIPKETESMEKRLVGVVHPDWKSVVQSGEYREWLENQDSDTITKAYHGKTAEEAVDVLNKYKSYRDSRSVRPKESSDEPGESTPSTSTKRKERLESSTVPSKRTQNRKPKAEADMTEEEYRAKVASELFE